ncbi:MAG: hypothetical protein EOR73_27810 [Mesorhizobium sp.]|uniref:hypothetical protein n=1 Tax=Mesorhizobium sp. TaxID=1871066 RepID=UPI000FE76828|nr:hypothetical protein [Mesorhizobium sp.]RWK45167.1 MAG: hypothetical protein EOR47_32175 [Mesorhizobium sp.]RWM13993.1 MAG: hypothetical protein EOR73_27810 [Mesorhizobium sp.]TIP84471.1 MAG: hypothetical protein E5X58_36140 [Mesorhizobium sp.]TIQ13123.1 MAG: hypothetical protein E5X57_10960 [Mesorhizobium sp.]
MANFGHYGRFIKRASDDAHKAGSRPFERHSSSGIPMRSAICASELVATLGLILTTTKAIPQFSELPMRVLSASVKFIDVLGFEVADNLLDNALMMPRRRGQATRNGC